MPVVCFGLFRSESHALRSTICNLDSSQGAVLLSLRACRVRKASRGGLQLVLRRAGSFPPELSRSWRFLAIFALSRDLCGFARSLRFLVKVSRTLRRKVRAVEPLAVLQALPAAQRAGRVEMSRSLHLLARSRRFLAISALSRDLGGAERRARQGDVEILALPRDRSKS